MDNFIKKMFIAIIDQIIILLTNFFFYHFFEEYLERCNNEDFDLIIPEISLLFYVITFLVSMIVYSLNKKAFYKYRLWCFIIFVILLNYMLLYGNICLSNFLIVSLDLLCSFLCVFIYYIITSVIYEEVIDKTTDFVDKTPFRKRY